MLKSLFSNRLFLGALAFFVLMIVGGTLYLRHIKRQGQIELERTQERLKQWEAQQKQTEKVPEGDTAQGGHFHADGTWHPGPHETEAPVVSPPVSDTGAVSASSVKIPDGITDPDILEAWQRLDYIAKNPFQWGGRPSDRALELMDELTPMWVFDDPHDHGEELMMTLDLLAEERDPRSAELLLTYQLDSPVSGRPIREALAAMGPASVPAVIARLNPEDAADVFMAPIIRDVVVPIVAQHRSELGSIVDYIILPRLEAIAALEDPPGDTFVVSNRSRARDALARIKK